MGIVGSNANNSHSKVNDLNQSTPATPNVPQQAGNKSEVKMNNAQSWNSLAASWQKTTPQSSFQKNSQSSFQQFKKMNEKKAQQVCSAVK